MNMNVDVNISLEELHVLETILAEEAKRAKHGLELLEKFGRDEVYEYQERQITLMNGMLEKLNVAYKQWLEEE